MGENITGFDNLPADVGRRILVAGWLILSVVLMTDVSSTFASLLSVNQNPERIESVSDIFKYPKLFPYIMKGWREQQLLMNSDDPELVALWKLILENDGLIEITDLGDPRIMDDVSDGRAVILSYRGSLLDILVGIVCQQEGGRDKEFYVASKDFELLLAAHIYRKGIDPEIAEDMNRA